MVSEKQRKARAAFVKKYAKKGKKMSTAMILTRGSRNFPLTRARRANLKAYDMRNKHNNWLRAKEKGISKKEFEIFWKNFTKLY